MTEILYLQYLVFVACLFGYIMLQFDVPNSLHL